MITIKQSFSNKTIVFCLILSLSQLGCSWFSSGEKKARLEPYQRVKETKELQLFEGYETDSLRDDMKIPTLRNHDKVESVSEPDIAPPLQIFISSRYGRLDSRSNSPAIFLKGQLHDVKSKIKAYLDLQSIAYEIETLDNHKKTAQVNDSALQTEKTTLNREQVEKKNVEKNSMNTESLNKESWKTNWMYSYSRGWLKRIFGSKKPKVIRDQFSINIHGDSPSAREHRIEVSHIEREQKFYGKKSWVSGELSREMEIIFLNRIIAFFENERRKDEQAYIKKITAGIKVMLGKNKENNSILTTPAEWNTVWNKTPKVLGPFGFELLDRNQTTSRYFFKFKPNSPGFFASIFGSSRGVKLPLPKGEYQVIVTRTTPVTIQFIGIDGELLADGLLAEIFPHLASAFARREEIQKEPIRIRKKQSR